MDQHIADQETVSTLAGAVRLMRRAAALEWARSNAEGPRSTRQLSALAVEVVAAGALDLLPPEREVDGPVPPGDDPAGLLRSAQALLLTITDRPETAVMAGLAARVGDLVWEVNTRAGA